MCGCVGGCVMTLALTVLIVNMAETIARGSVVIYLCSGRSSYKRIGHEGQCVPIGYG